VIKIVLLSLIFFVSLTFFYRSFLGNVRNHRQINSEAESPIRSKLLDNLLTN